MYRDAGIRGEVLIVHVMSAIETATELDAYVLADPKHTTF